MKTRNIAIGLAAVLIMTAVAMASPVFGTWRGELNGHAITVSVDHDNGRAVVTMTSDSQQIATSNAVFPKGGPPLQLSWQAANEGKMKLVSTANDNVSFELRSEDGRTATLRVFDGGKQVQTVQLVKQK